MFPGGQVSPQRCDRALGYETGRCKQRLSCAMARLDRLVEAYGAHTRCECADAGSRRLK